MGSMSAAVRKRRVILLVCFAVLSMTLYTFWGQPQSVAQIWEGGKRGALDRAQESATLLRQWADKEQELRRPDQSEHGSSAQPIGKTNVDVVSEKSKGTTNAVNAAIKPTIGKITISFGEADDVYERAIRSHELHNKMHGYSQFVLREKLVPGLWSKHAYIFSTVVQELAKPESERLKWLMWLDRDTVLMNPLLPLEMFVPPSGFEHINLLTTNDRHGLNNGVFFFRVCEWSLRLFTAAFTFPHYNPDIKLKYSEQSAMEEVLKLDYYNKCTARVPQRWFNAFPPPISGDPAIFHARPGHLLIHFASNRDGLRPERMTRWMGVADQENSEWRVPFNETSYATEIGEYWSRVGGGEDVGKIISDIEKRKE